MFPFLFFYKSRSKQSQRVPAATLRSPSAWQFLPIPSSMNLTAAEDFCRVVASQHYENFTVATRLVPRRLRQHLANVYAFARWSDDLADELASPEESRQAALQTGGHSSRVASTVAQRIRCLWPWLIPPDTPSSRSSPLRIC